LATTTEPIGQDAQRDLLFGLLALQRGFVSREALIEAFRAWRARPDRSMEGVLVERGAITHEARAALGPLVDLYVQLHGGDPTASVAALPVETVGVAAEAFGGPPASADDPTITYRSDTPGTTEAEAEAGGRPRDVPPPPAAPASADALGGRFRLLRPHAQGGLGRIFVAVDEELGREVAVKEIRPEHADDPASRARFLMEAEVTGAMEHPGLVPVYALGRHPDGRPYYAMRLVRGESLKDAIARLHAGRAAERAQGREPAPLGLALRPLLRRLLDVCDAVEYAHSRGVIHRDLKPANIMLGPFGETLVVDWGLAKPLGRAGEAVAAAEGPVQPSSGDTHETLPGRAVGTPAYMSPEQAAGDAARLGGPSDVYSLGATLYCLLTGRSPFGESDVEAVLRRVQLGQFPAPRSIRPEVPGALEAVCLKAMRLDPADRYPTPRAFADDLERWLADEPVTAWHEPVSTRLSRWARRHKATALAIVAALLGGLGAMTWAAVGYRQLAALERSERVEGLRVSARFAARTVAGEIDRRWRILEFEADDPELAALLDRSRGRPLDSPPRRALQAWIAARFATYQGAAAATNWFVCGTDGVQLAREPFNANTVGKNYAFRDYFHGLGRDLPESARDAEPIRRPHRSIVFRSQATGGHMVTFSVPVWSAHAGVSDRRVLGVLGMSVDLGRFGVLQLDLDADQVAVLVDARADADGVPGLILHHQHLAGFARHDAPAIHVGASEVVRMDALRRIALARKRVRESPGDGPPNPALARNGPPPGSLATDYRDPVGGAYAGRWLAAFEPVIVEGRPEPIDDTGWVVIVQERAGPSGY
jgi:serine/threonine protein kinase